MPRKRYARGMDRYLSKPFTSEQLYRVLEFLRCRLRSCERDIREDE